MKELGKCREPPNRPVVDESENSFLTWMSAFAAFWIAGDHACPADLRPAALERPHSYMFHHAPGGSAALRRQSASTPHTAPSPSPMRPPSVFFSLPEASSPLVGGRPSSRSSDQKHLAHAGLSVADVHHDQSFFLIPRVKFVLRGVLELAFLLLFAYVLLFTRHTSLSLTEAILYLWGFALAVDEFYQFALGSDWSISEHLDDKWNRVDFAKLSLLFIAASLRALAALAAAASSVLSTSFGLPFLPSLGLVALQTGAAEYANILLSFALACARLSRWTLSFGSLACCARLFAMLSLQQHMGVLFLSCTFMATDIFRFLYLLAVTMLGFGLCMAGIMHSSTLDVHDGNATLIAPSDAPFQPLLLPFWSLFGLTLGYEEHLLNFPRPLSCTLWVYFLLSQVVLLNLLVAIMGDTWQRVKDSADEEWKFLLVQDMEEFFDLHHVPPPFNALILLRVLYNHFTRGTCLTTAAKRWGPLLSAADIMKKSKVAQHDFLRKQQAAEARTAQAQLEKLALLQAASAECMEKLLADSSESANLLSRIAAVQRDMASGLTDRREHVSSPQGTSAPVWRRTRDSLPSPGQGSWQHLPTTRLTPSKGAEAAAPPLGKARSTGHLR